jgi:hypothetical protein
MDMKIGSYRPPFWDLGERGPSISLSHRPLNLFACYNYLMIGLALIKASAQNSTVERVTAEAGDRRRHNIVQ